MILHADFRTGAASGKILAALFDLARKTGVYDLPQLQEALRGVVPGAVLVCDTAADATDDEALIVDIALEGAPGTGKAPDAAGHVHEHHAWSDIRARIGSATTLTDGARRRALATYTVIAEAEAAVHGTPVEEVGFHEVGGPEAICNVVGSCVLLDALGVEELHATPVALGFGKVACAHGLLDIPAPATARIVARLPEGATFVGDVEGELTTPTGAALVAAQVTDFNLDATDSWTEASAPGAPGQADAAEVVPATAYSGLGAGRKRFAGMRNVMRVWA